jgi:hypothetical protein
MNYRYQGGTTFFSFLSVPLCLLYPYHIQRGTAIERSTHENENTAPGKLKNGEGKRFFASLGHAIEAIRLGTG